VLVCVALSDWFGTPDHTGWRHPVRNIVAAVGFATVVLLVNQFTAQRATRKGTVRTQAEELAREMRLPAELECPLAAASSAKHSRVRNQREHEARKCYRRRLV
jgi:hypothetical protein